MPQELGLFKPLELDDSPEVVRPFIIGLCGGDSAGKSRVLKTIMMKMDMDVDYIEEGDFYLPVESAEVAEWHNFDTPEAVDFTLMKTCLETLRHGDPFVTPQYQVTRHKRKKRGRKVRPRPVVVVQGLFILHVEEIRDLLDLKLFIDSPDDTRLANRVFKHMVEYHYTLDYVIEYYLKYTRIGYQTYIEPVMPIQSKRFADVIIPVANNLTNYMSSRPVHNLGIELMTSQIQHAISTPGTNVVKKADVLKKLGLVT